ncbi:MAG: hypothetical protein QUU85_05320, partial [Candidatus Eisenbacteria bacterium]|nr:hypothetical protein [Candidatus Eisenbacteria bacterium]
SGRILDRMMERVRAKPTRQDDVTVLIVKALAIEPARTASVAGTGEAPGAGGRDPAGAREAADSSAAARRSYI